MASTGLPPESRSCTVKSAPSAEVSSRVTDGAAMLAVATGRIGSPEKV